MNKTIKLLSYATIFLSGFSTTEIMANCPELTRDEIRTICRWKAINKITLGLVAAGGIEKNGVKLNNNGTCGEKDSLEQFWKHDNQKTYPGKLTKDFAEPNNALKGLCTYDLGHQKIGFAVTLPPKPTSPAPVAEKQNIDPNPPKKPKIVGGVDITSSPQVQNVIIKPRTPPQVPPRPRQLPSTPDQNSGHGSDVGTGG
jgi:hypothetical protein